jgi:hypothetical protein
MRYSSDRVFQVWDYRVSHKQLLIRSPRGPECSENIDLVFWGVRALQVPTTLHGIELNVLSLITGTAIGGPEPVGIVRKFVLSSGGEEFRIDAEGCKVLKNERDIFESTLVDFAIDHPVEWYGCVLECSEP